MEFIECFQGQGEGNRGRLVLVPYLRRDSSRCSGELWSPGEPGRSSGSPPSSRLGAINISLLRGDEGLPPTIWTGPPGRGACLDAWCIVSSLDL